MAANLVLFQIRNNYLEAKLENPILSITYTENRNLLPHEIKRHTESPSNSIYFLIQIFFMNFEAAYYRLESVCVICPCPSDSTLNFLLFLKAYPTRTLCDTPVPRIIFRKTGLRHRVNTA